MRPAAAAAPPAAARGPTAAPRAGKDVIGLAQTGSGKTGAFALPILQVALCHRSGQLWNPRLTVLAARAGAARRAQPLLRPCAVPHARAGPPDQGAGRGPGRQHIRQMRRAGGRHRHGVPGAASAAIALAAHQCCCRKRGPTAAGPQAVALGKSPHIVVGTPGRVVDHLSNTKASCSCTCMGSTIAARRVSAGVCGCRASRCAR